MPRDSYDDMVTSGDVTSAVIMERPGQSVFHLGPPRDLPIYEGLNVQLKDVETADYVVCSGLFDDTKETPEDYRAMLERMKARGLFMLCANPDVVVERGNELVYCAGALADLYKSMGGDVLYAGKPYAPIYERALARAKALRKGEVPLDRVLAIGDSVRTDLDRRGGARRGFPVPDRRHSRRRNRRRGQSRRRKTLKLFLEGQPDAESGDAPAGVVTARRKG